MADRTYSLCGFASGVDWRPITFKDPLPQARVCDLCSFVPCRMAFLPCGHVFCSACVERCTGDDDRGACPLDRTPFLPNACGFWLPDPREQLAKLQVRCWNWKQGCDFRGPLGQLLEHFEQQCGFHTTSCPRCQDEVFRNDVPGHCSAGCHAVDCAEEEDEEPAAQHTSTAVLLESSIGSYRDVLESIENKVDVLAEELNSLSAGFAQEVRAEWDAISASLHETMSVVAETCDELRGIETRLDSRADSFDGSEPLHTRRSSF